MHARLIVFLRHWTHLMNVCTLNQIDPGTARAGGASRQPDDVGAADRAVVSVAREPGREIATGKEAREIYKIGTWHDSASETLAANGMAPTRNAGRKCLPLRAA
jgi:hypothetical protein